MKDEIKEILNNADSSTKFKMVDEDGTEKEMNIAGLIEQLLNDNRNLLDYITNLQDKYERMKENAEILSNGYNELEKRIDKAIEYIEKGNKHFKENYNEPYEYAFMVNADELMKILQGKSDE